MHAHATRRPGRLPRTVTPVAYDLVLEVDPRRPEFAGECTVHVDVAFETDRIPLHARGPRVARAEARLPDGRVLTGAVRPGDGPGAEPGAGEILLHLPELLPRGPVELYLAFEAPFDPQLAGLYRVQDAGEWYAFTQFEAADARRCFPCFDEPGFKTPFRTTLIVPAEMGAFANAPQVEEEARGEQRVVRFAETAPLPTYLVAFAVGPFEVVEAPDGPGTPIRALAPRGKGELTRTALSFARPLLAELEAYFGRPYPYDKLDLVAVPEFGAGAMENAGLITFREEYLLADPDRLTRSRERLLAEVMAHEMAHQWFGNLVTMHWWEDLWLNEAFATWMAAKVVDAWRPRFDQVMELLQVRTRVMATDSLPAARKVRQEVGSVGDAEQAFDDLTYYKGAAILTMLEKWVGEQAFREGVRAYIDHHAWRNAAAADLFSHLDRASGRDVSGVARTFLEQPGVPLVTWVPDDGGLVLRQRPASLLGLDPPCPPDTRWHIPIARPDGGWELLEKAEAKLPGPLPRHPNPGEWSYYRWELPEDALAELAGAGELDVRSRLGLLENAWAMVASGRRKPSAWLRVLEAQRQARARPVVEELAGAVARLVDVWEELAGEADFARFASRVLGAHYERLGWEAAPGEDEDDTITRPSVLAVLGRHARTPEVRAGAVDRAARYLDDPAAVPSDVAATCLGLAALEGGLSFADALALYGRAADPEQRLAALKALAMQPPGEAIEQSLELTVSDRFRAQDFHYVFRDALARPETRAQAFAWFQRRFDAVRGRQPEFTFVHIGTIVGQFRSEAERDAARSFLESRHIPGGERAIRQGVERADHLIALRRAGADDVRRFLAERR